MSSGLCTSIFRMRFGSIVGWGLEVMQVGVCRVWRGGRFVGHVLWWVLT